MHLIAALILVAISSTSVLALLGGRIGPTQSVAVQGTLFCNGQPSVGTKVKLYDNNHFTIDNFLSSGTTNAQGFFMLRGTVHEFSSMAPKVNIYHKCNDNLPCDKKISISIPKSYVASGSTPAQTFRIGLIDLAGKQKGETRDCFNKK